MEEGGGGKGVWVWVCVRAADRGPGGDKTYMFACALTAIPPTPPVPAMFEAEVARSMRGWNVSFLPSPRPCGGDSVSVSAAPSSPSPATSCSSPNSRPGAMGISSSCVSMSS